MHLNLKLLSPKLMHCKSVSEKHCGLQSPKISPGSGRHSRGRQVTLNEDQSNLGGFLNSE